MNLEQARVNMIEQQIRTWEVLDKEVLKTLVAVRREAFVPAAYQALAFVDTEIPLPGGENMLSPKLEARLLQEAFAAKVVGTIKGGGSRLQALLVVTARSLLMDGVAGRANLMWGFYPSAASTRAAAPRNKELSVVESARSARAAGC